MANDSKRYKQYFKAAHEAQEKSKMMMEQIYAQAKKEGKSEAEIAAMKLKDGT